MESMDGLKGLPLLGMEGTGRLPALTGKRERGEFSRQLSLNIFLQAEPGVK